MQIGLGTPSDFACRYLSYSLLSFHKLVETKVFTVVICLYRSILAFKAIELLRVILWFKHVKAVPLNICARFNLSVIIFGQYFTFFIKYQKMMSGVWVRVT